MLDLPLRKDCGETRERTFFADSAGNHGRGAVESSPVPPLAANPEPNPPNLRLEATAADVLSSSNCSVNQYMSLSSVISNLNNQNSDIKMVVGTPSRY